MDESIRALLDRWVTAGLLTAEQASAIADHEAAPEAPPVKDEGPSVLTEVIGYLGAALIITAGGLVVDQFWDRITGWGQVLLTATITAVLIGAGWALRDRETPAIRRLVSLLWAAGVIGVAFTVGVATGPAALDATNEWAVVLTSTAVLAAAVPLYALRRSPLQLVAVAAGLMATAGSSLTFVPGELPAVYLGLPIWAIGAAWLLLTQDGWLTPQRTAQALGLLALGVGAQIMGTDSEPAAGLVLALVSTAAVLAIAVPTGSLVMLGFGVAGVLIFVPQAVFHFFGESLGAPIALLLTGLLLVGGAVGLVPLRREVAEAATGEDGS